MRRGKAADRCVGAEGVTDVVDNAFEAAKAVATPPNKARNLRFI